MTDEAPEDCIVSSDFSRYNPILELVEPLLSLPVARISQVRTTRVFFFCVAMVATLCRTSSLSSLNLAPISSLGTSRCFWILSDFVLFLRGTGAMAPVEFTKMQFLHPV